MFKSIIYWEMPFQKLIGLLIVLNFTLYHNADLCFNQGSELI